MGQFWTTVSTVSDIGTGNGTMVIPVELTVIIMVTCEVRVGKFRVEKYLRAKEPFITDIHSEPALCDAVNSLVLLDIFVGVLVKPGKKNEPGLLVTKDNLLNSLAILGHM